MPTPRDYEAAGLYDPGKPDAADRLALLDWLAAQGATIERMVEALAEGSLTGLAGDLALRPGTRLRLADVAAHSNLSPEQVQAISLASGLPPAGPDERAYTYDDAVAFAAFGGGALLFGDEGMAHFSRVIGSSLARIAEAAVSLFLSRVEGPILQAGVGSLALAQANLRAIQALGTIPPVIQTVLRAHMETAIRRSRQARGRQGEPMRLTVGFVDLVGFTPLSRRLAPEELGELVDRFEALAHDVVTEHDGRVVKLIGDEVMYVAVDAGAACDIALTLVDRFTADANVTPRGGLAHGPVVTRGGDYYGPVVNLASRLAELAVPNEVLVTPDVAAGARAGAFRFEPAGKRMLKGFDAPVTLHAVERA
jgi:class 3 adenylate cyclase